MKPANDKWIRTGIELVDTQHAEYFRRLDILLLMIGNSELNGYGLRKGFDFFRSYAVVHFDTEELLMKISSFPEIEEHVKAHDFFRDNIDRMAEDLNVGKDVPEVAEELKLFLTGWLEDHIESYDLKLTRFLNEKLSSGLLEGNTSPG
ncbi:MAG: hemerythrin family protein [Victivallales bacterium]